jgi:Protein of unknown function (DUF2889)
MTSVHPDLLSAHMTRTRVLDLRPVDEETYAFRASLLDQAQGGRYESGSDTEVVHDFLVKGRVARRDLRILELAVEAVTHPYAACPNIVGVAQKLVGASLNIGWRRTVLKHLGGSQGCTHVTTLLLSLSELIAPFYFLEANQSLPYGKATRADGSWMKACLAVSGSLDGACHVLASDGEVIGRAKT